MNKNIFPESFIECSQIWTNKTFQIKFELLSLVATKISISQAGEVAQGVKAAT